MHNCAVIQVAERGDVTIKIAQNLQDPNLDTEELSKYDSVEVRSLNFSALVGAGILHTKLWIVDRWVGREAILFASRAFRRKR